MTGKPCSETQSGVSLWFRESLYRSDIAEWDFDAGSQPTGIPSHDRAGRVVETVGGGGWWPLPL